MACSRCHRVALYVVDKAGYCKEHKDLAFGHAALVNSRYESLKTAQIREYRQIGTCKRHYK